MKFLSILLAVILLGAVFLNYHTVVTGNEEREALREQLTKTYQDELRKLESELRRSKHREDSLAAILVTVDSRNKDLLDSLAVKDEEIARVKGRYNRHTPTELESEMMKRFNESK